MHVFRAGVLGLTFLMPTIGSGQFNEDECLDMADTLYESCLSSCDAQAEASMRAHDESPLGTMNNSVNEMMASTFERAVEEGRLTDQQVQAYKDLTWNTRNTLRDSYGISCRQESYN